MRLISYLVRLKQKKESALTVIRTHKNTAYCCIAL